MDLTDFEKLYHPEKGMVIRLIENGTDYTFSVNYGVTEGEIIIEDVVPGEYVEITRKYGDFVETEKIPVGWPWEEGVKELVEMYDMEITNKDNENG